MCFLIIQTLTNHPKSEKILTKEADVMKKFISIVLVVVLSCSALFVTAYASDTKTGALLEEIKAPKAIY